MKFLDKYEYNLSNLLLLEYFFAPLVNAKRFFEEPFQLCPLIIEQCSGASSFWPLSITSGRIIGSRKNRRPLE